MPLLRAHAKFCLGVHLKFIMKGLKFFLDANFLSFLVGYIFDCNVSCSRVACVSLNEFRPRPPPQNLVLQVMS